MEVVQALLKDLLGLEESENSTLMLQHLSTVIILYYVRYYILSEPSTNSFRWMKSGVDRKM